MTALTEIYKHIGNVTRRIPKINVHHLSYENMGNELVGDLAVLCIDCHDEVEARVTAMIQSGQTRKAALASLKDEFTRRMCEVHEMYGRWQNHGLTEPRGSQRRLRELLREAGK